ncbi:MAG: DUF2442 domain-containing protein [Bacteroidia bacterium]|nr:DUF2442 domain-containing protein [Bacteroidia bacterium]
MLPRIKKIISVEPYQILCLWNTGEIRSIDLFAQLKAYTNKHKSPYFALLDKNTFKQVKYDAVSQTIYWDNLISMIDANDNTIPAAFDFCPDVLYEISKIVAE